MCILCLKPSADPICDKCANGHDPKPISKSQLKRLDIMKGKPKC